MKATKLFVFPAILAALTFASCSDYDNGFTEKQIRYEQAFHDAFGDIDPAQDWNLVRQLAEKGTRKSEPGWVDNPVNGPSDLYHPDEFNDTQKAIVRLFFQNNKYLKGISYPYTEFFAQHIYSGNKENRNLDGAASDCEEVYTAADGNVYDAGQMNHFTVGPEGKQFHIDSFNSGDCKGSRAGSGMYAQDADASLFGYTNSANSYVTGHYVIIDGETIDAWAQSEEGKKILQSQGIEFETVATATSYSYAKVNNEIVKSEGQPVKRYYLGFDFVLYEDERAYATDYGTGKYMLYEFEGEKYHYLMSNMNMYCGDVKNYDDKPDANTIRELLKNGYLPVDGKADKTWVKLGTCANGYYSDWIISITPGKPGDPTPTESERVLESALLVCEDLGDYDFDFNDIVLKLEHIRSTTAEIGKEPKTDDIFRITAMAAGGTLPSYVYYKPLRAASQERSDEVESTDLWTWLDYAKDDDDMTNGIHHMVDGIPGNLVPLNVGERFPDDGEGHVWDIDINDAIRLIETSSDYGNGRPIKEYVNSYVSYVFDFSRIRIYVGEEMKDPNGNQTYIAPIEHGIDYGTDNNSSKYKTANTPQMLLLPLDFEWAQECVPIANAYPQFRDWVRNMTFTDWYKEGITDSVTVRTGLATGEVVGGGSGNNGGDNSGNGEDNDGTQITNISYHSSGLSPKLGNDKWLESGYKIPASVFENYASGITLTVVSSQSANIGWTIGSDVLRDVYWESFGEGKLKITLTQAQVEAAKTYGFQFYSQGQISNLEIRIK